MRTVVSWSRGPEGGREGHREGPEQRQDAEQRLRRRDENGVAGWPLQEP